MQVERVYVEIGMGIPQDVGNQYTPSHRPVFRAEGTIEQGEDVAKATESLSRWVLWQFLKLANRCDNAHARICMDGLDKELKRFFKKHPTPPPLRESG